MQATTVAARGVAEAPYTIANFALVLYAKGKSVPSAKAKLKNKIDDLNEAFTKMKESLSLEFVKSSVRTNSQVQEDWEYLNQKRELAGYMVTYSLAFQIDTLDKVNKVFDVLTSLPEVGVSNPTFGLKPTQREKLSKKALKNAFSKAQERFETECTVLGLDAAHFEISNWEVKYHDSHRGNNVGRALSAGATLNAMSESIESGPMGAPGPDGATGDAGEIDLVAGLAEVAVNLEVGYVKKPMKSDFKKTHDQLLAAE
jgi:uncharacterized protein YggE